MKRFAILCALCAVVMSLFGGVAWALPNEIPLEATGPNITIGQVAALPTTEVIVPIDIAQNPGFSALMFNVVYDPTQLKLNNVSDIALGEAFSGLRLVILGGGEEGQFGIYVMGDDARPDLSAVNGTLATVKFTVIGALGTRAEINPNTLYATDAAGGSIAYTLNPGAVSIAENVIEVPGEATAQPSPLPLDAPFVAVAGIIQLPDVAVTGYVLQLSGKIYPENATNTAIIWSVLDAGTTRAIISGDAFLATDSGLAQVRLTIPGGVSGGDYVKDFYVVVSKSASLIMGVRLNKSSLQLAHGKTDTTLSAEVFPDDVPNRDVRWSSSNPAVVKVDEFGTVTAVGVGSAVVTASAGNFDAQCQVLVEPVMVAALTMNVTTASISVSGAAATIKLRAEVFPLNASNPNVAWTSSDSTIASVDKDGLVTGGKSGEAVITATAVDSQKTAICIVTVFGVQVESVSISGAPKNNMLFIGDTVALSATVTPLSAPDAAVVWSSSDPEVAVVSPIGVITALKPGSTLIRATSVASASAFADLTIAIIPLPQVTPTPTPKPTPTQVIITPVPTAVNVAPAQPIIVGTLNAEATREASSDTASDGQISAKVVDAPGKKFEYSLDGVNWTKAASTSTVFKRLAPGRYTVFARENSASGVTLTKPVEVVAIVKKGAVTPPKLTAPQNFAASLIIYNTAQLTWSGVPGAKGYDIYRTTDGKSYTKIAYTIKLTLTDNTLSGEKKKFGYKVCALGSNNESGPFSDVRVVTNFSAANAATPEPTPSAQTISLAAPTAVKAVGGKGAIKITFDAVIGASGYEIGYTTTPDGKFTKIATIDSIGKREYVHSGLTSGATYYYKVRAYAGEDRKALGAMSSEVSATAK